jgi:hypothetical protein
MTTKPPGDDDDFDLFTLDEVAISDLPPPADIDFFPEEIPTSPELRDQIVKNDTTSRAVVSQAATVLAELKRLSVPPKE